MSDQPFRGEVLPDVQTEPPVAQAEAFPSRLVAGCSFANMSSETQ